MGENTTDGLRASHTARSASITLATVMSRSKALQQPSPLQPYFTAQVCGGLGPHCANIHWPRLANATMHTTHAGACLLLPTSSGAWPAALSCSALVAVHAIAGKLLFGLCSLKQRPRGTPANARAPSARSPHAIGASKGHTAKGLQMLSFARCAFCPAWRHPSPRPPLSSRSPLLSPWLAARASFTDTATADAQHTPAVPRHRLRTTPMQLEPMPTGHCPLLHAMMRAHRRCMTRQEGRVSDSRHQESTPHSHGLCREGLRPRAQPTMCNDDCRASNNATRRPVLPACS